MTDCTESVGDPGREGPAPNRAAGVNERRSRFGGADLGALRMSSKRY